MRPIILDEKGGFNEKQKRNIAILETLRRFGPLSRPDISQRLGVNIVTVSNYVEDFIKNRMVLERELDVSEGGRRPVLLELNSNAAFSIGVGLNLTNMVGILVDLKGNIVLKTQAERPGVTVSEVVECVLGLIREIIRRSKDYIKDIKGIGVGIAGIIDKKSGSVRWPERVKENDTYYASVNFALKDLIERGFGLPVIIENDATSACFGEQWLVLDPSVENILYMFSGVGCGIIINGQIYTGGRGCAGELSIHNYKQDHLFNCSLGAPCFLKRWETDLGIVTEVRNRLSVNPQEGVKIRQLADNKIENINLKTIFLAARGNDDAAKFGLDTAAKRLGIEIAYLVNFLNPDVVIIGGGFEEAGEEFLIKVEQTVREWAFREMTEDLKIVYSMLRENAVALGAASLVLRQVFAHL